MTTPMTRRGFLGFGAKAVGVAVIAGAAGLLVKPKVAEAVMPWHGYSQAQRNNLIRSRAGLNLYQCVGRNCKQWAYDVVASASGSVMYLPNTADVVSTYGKFAGQTLVGCAWYWQYSQDVIGSVKPIQNVQPGEIIQMKWETNTISSVTGEYWTPHTAIVYSNDYYLGVTFIESNWDVALSVSTRYIPFNTFNQRVHLYTVYDIL